MSRSQVASPTCPLASVESIMSARHWTANLKANRATGLRGVALSHYKAIHAVFLHHCCFDSGMDMGAELV
eukprot:85937-Amphidinium_carterae.1